MIGRSTKHAHFSKYVRGPNRSVKHSCEHYSVIYGNIILIADIILITDIKAALTVPTEDARTNKAIDNESVCAATISIDPNGK